VVGGEKYIHDFSQIYEGPRQQGIQRHVWNDNVTSPTREDTIMWTGFIWPKIGPNV
jgi:hypothetical protein